MDRLLDPAASVARMERIERMLSYLVDERDICKREEVDAATRRLIELVHAEPKAFSRAMWDQASTLKGLLDG